MICECDNCGYRCDPSRLKEVQDLAERLDYPEGDPRCIMPEGECPICGCLSYDATEEAEYDRAVARSAREHLGK